MKEEETKVKRKIIEIDEELCDGCGLCIPSCQEGALQIVDGKARLVSESICDGLGACIGECPKGALRIVEREAEEFDEESVKKHLESHREEVLQCGCPSTLVQRIEPLEVEEVAEERKAKVVNIRNWPVQINLIPSSAPFLKGAELLVCADCVPVAYPHFHSTFMDGRVVMVGCPKFDDVDGYIEKFSEIFRSSDIKSIHTVIMEVPCCGGLPLILKRAMEKAQKEIPMKETIVDIRGRIKSGSLK